jgi:hypothetical protein
MNRNSFFLLALIAAALPAFGQSAPSSAPQSGSSSSSAEVIEAYEGKLADSDAEFRLELTKGGTASADWTDRSGETRHYSGTYEGTRGAYTINLRQTGVRSAGTIRMGLRQQGDQEVGRFMLNGSGVQRSVTALHLVEIETTRGHHGAHKAAANARVRLGKGVGSKPPRLPKVNPPKPPHDKP